MSCLKLLRSHKTQTIWIFILSFILTCSTSLMPVWAQANSTAAISVDGRVLFRVSRLEGFDAQPRADYANEILNRAVESGEPVTVQLQSPAFAIRTTGKAMANGAEGDRIGVENATTRRVVQGTVTGEGKVTVEF